ncbi:hypothetical protein RB213_010983 [Colletotrichum asianum]
MLVPESPVRPLGHFAFTECKVGLAPAEARVTERLPQVDHASAAAPTLHMEHYPTFIQGYRLFKQSPRACNPQLADFQLGRSTSLTRKSSASASPVMN